MTREEFVALYTENPSSDEVMTEINRLYDAETQLTADFATADSDRERLKSEVEDLNKRYRERFFNGPGKPETKRTGNPFDAFFKEKE